MAWLWGWPVLTLVALATHDSRACGVTSSSRSEATYFSRELLGICQDLTGSGEGRIYCSRGFCERRCRPLLRRQPVSVSSVPTGSKPGLDFGRISPILPRNLGNQHEISPVRNGPQLHKHLSVRPLFCLDPPPHPPKMPVNLIANDGTKIALLPSQVGVAPQYLPSFFDACCRLAVACCRASHGSAMHYIYRPLCGVLRVCCLCAVTNRSTSRARGLPTHTHGGIQHEFFQVSPRASCTSLMLCVCRLSSCPTCSTSSVRRHLMPRLTSQVGCQELHFEGVALVTTAVLALRIHLWTTPILPDIELTLCMPVDRVRLSGGGCGPLLIYLVCLSSI